MWRDTHTNWPTHPSLIPERHRKGTLNWIKELKQRTSACASSRLQSWSAPDVLRREHHKSNAFVPAQTLMQASLAEVRTKSRARSLKGFAALAPKGLVKFLLPRSQMEIDFIPITLLRRLTAGPHLEADQKSFRSWWFEDVAFGTGAERRMGVTR